MSGPWQSAEKRLLELLADRATFGLEPEEQCELDELRRAMPDFETDSVELAAATVQLARLPSALEPLPSALEAKVRAQARVCVTPISPTEPSHGE